MVNQQYLEQFAPKPARPPYQLTRPITNQLAPLILPTRPNSPQLLPARPTSLTNSPHVFVNSPYFSDQTGWAYDCSSQIDESK